MRHHRISFSPRFYYQIEKHRQLGPYLNTPWRWYYCGTIRARDDAEALRKAMFAVGSSRVRVERVP